MDLNKKLDLSGMVALVTGGGNGIGCGSAHILAQAGADVVIGDLNLAVVSAGCALHEGGRVWFRREHYFDGKY